MRPVTFYQILLFFLIFLFLFSDLQKLKNKFLEIKKKIKNIKKQKHKK